jgi:hypothetical protein
MALASSGTDPAILGNGVPAANLDNCNIMSNTGMTCHGHNTGATNGDAHTTNNGCGITQNSNAPVVADPYKSLASNIPANTCGGSYPQKSGGLQTKWSGAKTLVATTIVCGDLQLTADTTLTTASSGSVLVIENGQLDVNGFKLVTVAGSALTIIFSGTAGSYTHMPTGGGTLDFNAPSSGTWSGVAVYQDPALTTGVDISAAGATPIWNISGLIYLPHSSVLFSGAVNQSSNGASCFGLVVDNITINGTGEIQNAADAAAVAAARNGTSSYESEAKAVAAQYGFVDGSGGVTVTALNNQICPNGQTNCYSVTVAMSAAPQFFSQVVGIPAPPGSSSAMAGGGQTHSYCLLPLPAAAPIRRSPRTARPKPISAVAA